MPDSSRTSTGNFTADRRDRPFSSLLLLKLRAQVFFARALRFIRKLRTLYFRFLALRKLLSLQTSSCRTENRPPLRRKLTKKNGKSLLDSPLVYLEIQLFFIMTAGIQATLNAFFFVCLWSCPY